MKILIEMARTLVLAINNQSLWAQLSFTLVYLKTDDGKQTFRHKKKGIRNSVILKKLNFQELYQPPNYRYFQKTVTNYTVQQKKKKFT